MSQHDRILRWLRERGEKGVHSFELFEAKMPRGAAVIKVLRDEGYDIESRREPYFGKSQGVRYVLRSAPSLSRGPEPEPEPQLIASGSRSGSQYDPYSEWS
jgi:winged helix domain-containing protein